MSATYNVVGHGLLSPEADALYAEDATAFDALVETAEILLRLDGTTYTGADLNKAKLAIVRQVNKLLVMTPESQVLSMNVRSSRTQAFKSNSDIDELDPIAVRLVTALGVTFSDDTYETIRSLR